MKCAVGVLTALVSSVFTLGASRVQQGSGVKSPFPSFLVLAVLVLILGQDCVARADLLDGLQLHIEFEDNVVDSSSNSFDGQASGDLQYAAGVIGQAATFDGVDDQVLFPTFSDSLITDSDFSVSFWFNLPSGPLLSVLGKRESCSVSPFFDIRRSANGSMVFEVSDSSGFHQLFSPATTAGWHHVALTRTGTNLEAFLDGALVAQTTTPSTLDLSNTATLGLSNSPCIGSDATQMLVGGLDDLRIYTRLLTDSEIFDLGGILAGIFADGFESSDTSAWSRTVQ